MPRFILGGSIEVSPEKYITCAVFEGEHEWDIRGNTTIRYVKFPLGNSKKTILEVASEAYDKEIANGTKS